MCGRSCSPRALQLLGTYLLKLLFLNVQQALNPLHDFSEMLALQEQWTRTHACQQDPDEQGSLAASSWDKSCSAFLLQKSYLVYPQQKWDSKCSKHLLMEMRHRDQHLIFLIYVYLVQRYFLETEELC